MSLKVRILIHVIFSVITISIFTRCNQENKKQNSQLKIDLWYGQEQYFGIPGNPQRAINILGNVACQDSLVALRYSLNEGHWQNLSVGPDGRRLAGKGDFNIEILRMYLSEGKNIVQIKAEDSNGIIEQQKVIVHYTNEKTWPLAYEIDWNNVDLLQKAVYIIDGKWVIVPDGIRTVEPYYDRILAFGDSTWRDFEILVSVIFHDYAEPLPGPPTFNVSHAALAMRWPGHDDDGNQPRVKWYPLGATCEMQLKTNLDSCRWRILGGGSKTENIHALKTIELGKKYMMKSRVESLENDSTQYSVKFWEYHTAEPDEWDLQATEGPEDVQYGSGLLISHNTDVTFGYLKVSPLPGFSRYNPSDNSEMSMDSLPRNSRLP